VPEKPLVDKPSYLILGRGRWAGLIHNVLIQGERRVTRLEESRMRPDELESGYRARLTGEMAASGANIVWMCIPFGRWVPAIAAAALDCGLDVIAECPWLCPPEVSDSLLAVALKNRRLLGVHYEYCLLDEVHAWRNSFAGGKDCTFNGVFEISRAGRHGAVAELQLGSHLMAIRQYAVPEAGIGEVRCRFGGRDRRVVWLEREGERVSTIDFQTNRQPIIQRFIQAFESGREGAGFHFGLEFAIQVAAEAGLLTV
jgi:hypothetical protein